MMTRCANRGQPGFWKEYKISLAGLDADCKAGHAKRCREEKEESLAEKHRRDLKALEDWPEVEDLQAAAWEGCCTVVLVADKYKEEEELPKAARGAVNCAAAGVIHYDTFASRKDWAANKQSTTSTKQPATNSRHPPTGNKQQATSNTQQTTCNKHKASNWVLHPPPLMHSTVPRRPGRRWTGSTSAMMSWTRTSTAEAAASQPAAATGRQGAERYQKRQHLQQHPARKPQPPQQQQPTEAATAISPAAQQPNKQQLPYEDQDYKVCEKHKTWKTYGDVAKVLTNKVFKFFVHYRLLPRPENCKTFLVPYSTKAKKVYMPGCLQLFNKRHLKNSKVILLLLLTLLLLLLLPLPLFLFLLLALLLLLLLLLLLHFFCF